MNDQPSVPAAVTAPPVAEEGPVLPKVDPETFALRGHPPRAIRFKRGVIVSLMAAAAVSVVGIAWFALKPHAVHLVASGDDQMVLAKSPSDTLSALPPTYGAVPKLGPPLPGDLGKPILDRQQQLVGLPMAPSGQSVRGSSAEDLRQRQLAEVKAARESGLLVTSGSHEAGNAGTASGLVTKPGTPDATAKLALDPVRDPNGQQRKTDFLQVGEPKDTINGHPFVPSPSPYMLSAGTIIAASLITGLRSDLPGLVTAQVTERVFDSATGRILLIPQGARLLGSYDSVISYGQRRALVVWQRLIYPDGSSISLDKAPASDPSGYAGLSDKVDSHGWAVLKGALLSTMLGVTTELQFGGNGGIAEAISQSSQQSVGRAGDQLIGKSLQIQPTITVRPGASVRLLVHQDLILKPWTER